MKLKLQVWEANTDWGKYRIKYIPAIETVQIIKRRWLLGPLLVADIKAKTLRELLKLKSPEERG